MARALLLALALAAGIAAAPGRAVAAGGQTLTPPYQAGPHGGDQFNVVNTDPKSGRVTVLRAYPEPGAFNCGGQGGWADLVVTPTLQADTSSVTVAYKNSAWDSYTWLTVVVRDGQGTWLGGQKLRGPVAGSGTLTLPIQSPAGGPVPAGTAVDVQFGIEVASACPNVDGGSIQFTGVTLGTGGSVPPPPLPGVPPLPTIPSPPAGLTVPFGVVSAINFQFFPGDDDFVRKVPLEIQEGDGLVFVGADTLAPHTVTADAVAPDGTPLFDSGAPTSAGELSPVVGVATLPTGTYSFHCSVHTQMRGALVVLKPAPVLSARIAW